MPLLTDIKEALLHIAFPHLCQRCGTDVLNTSDQLCPQCIIALPKTSFELFPDNPIEHYFWGRLDLVSATAQYYFTKDSGMQHLMHVFKYQRNQALGMFLGKLMGQSLLAAPRFSGVDALVPLPLFKSKERARGFNQATVLCKGISEAWGKPVWTDVVIRTEHTESQTKKNRIERWQNMRHRFEIINEEKIRGKHLLLVDDVVTTGATLEACGNEILQAEDTRLSVATLCLAVRS